MQEIRTEAQEAEEDIFFGQVSLIAARYFLIVGGLILVLTTAKTQAEFALSIVPIVFFIMMNFFLHARYVMGQPANRAFILAANTLDLLIITAIVMAFGTENGLKSQFFVFYFPVLAAFGFVFPRRIEASYTVVACVLYGLACLVTGSLFEATPDDTLINAKTLGLRLIAMAAVGGLANYYFRILRARRRAVGGGTTLPGAAPIAMGPAG